MIELLFGQVISPDIQAGQGVKILKLQKDILVSRDINKLDIDKGPNLKIIDCMD